MINIIFDFDGVIINSHKIKTLAFYNIFKSYGKNIGLKARKFHTENIGKSGRKGEYPSRRKQGAPNS